MSFLGLFKLRDATKDQILLRNTTKKEFMNKLSLATDQSTNVGSLSKGKEFHGLLSADKFRLKKNQTFMSESFVINGEIKTQNQDLIIDVEYVRGVIPTLLPTLLFVMCMLFFVDVLKGSGVDLRYIPFIVVCGLLVFWALDVKRKSEIEKIKKLFRSTADKNAR